MNIRGKHKGDESVEAPVPKKKPTLLKNVVNVVDRRQKEINKPNNNNNTQKNPVNNPRNEEPDISTQTSDVARIMIAAIKKILERNFKDPIERLNLNFIPPCLYNLKKCAEKHSKRAPIPETTHFDNQYIAKQMLVEDRYFQFVKFVTDMCGRNEFPGSGLITSILEQILILEEDAVKNDIYSLNEVLDELYCLFNQILLTFPPCNLRYSYLEAFTNSLETDLITEASGGILDVVLDLLSDCMYNQTEVRSTRKSQSTKWDKLNNYNMWEMEQDNRNLFEHFDRPVKFDRIFKVLALVVKVLETDLATWMIKYSSKMYSYMNRDDRCPMVSSLIYQNYDNVMLMSPRIKKIISMYVDMVALEYPKAKIEVFARLLNLIATCDNLHEYPDDAIEYPTYKNITLDFVNGIKREIENSSYYSFKLYLNVVDSIKTPLIKMLLCNLMLQKIDKIPVTPSLQQVFDLIKGKSFLSCAAVSSRKLEAKSLVKYPVCEKNKSRSAKFEIYQDEYLKMLLIYAKSIVGVYRIHECSKELQNKQIATLSQQESTLSLISQNSFQDYFDFDDKNIAALANRVNLNEKVQLATKDNKFRKQIQIRLSKDECKFYRHEIKFYLHLKSVIPVCLERYGESFREWMKFMRDLEK